MSGNTTSLYGSNSSSNTASTNFTTLYSSGNTVAPIGVGYGNANVAGFLAAGSDTGGNVIANITATGNIQTSGFFIGNFLGNISGNLIVPGSNTQILYNNNGNAGASNNFRFSSSNNLMTLSGNASISGNVTGGNITTPGQISAAGNVRTTGIISATGNVTGYYFIGNGSQLTGVVTNVYGNSNVTSLLANLGSNVISTTGNVTGGNLRTAGQVTATGNVTGGNVLTAGQVSATGNVTGNYILGNGSQLTGIASIYGNAQVASFLNAFGSNSISTTGNVTASYFAGNGSELSNITAGNITGQVANALVAGTVYTAAQPNITSVGILTAASVSGNITGGNIATAGQVSAAGNITAANFIGNITGNVGGGSISVAGNITGGNLLTGGLISAAGNITGNVFVGNGAGLTSLVGATVTGQVGNALVAGTVYTAAQPNITSVGILTSASVSGNITTGGQISATGNVTAPNFIGNIAGNIAGGFISVSGNITGGNLLTGGLISATGNITGGNVSGATVTATTLNTVTASATGNVTGGNILTGGLISATGNVTSGNLINNGTITSTGNITAPNFFGNVSGNITGNIDAAGSNTQVQFNDTGDILGASAGFTFDKTANLMTVTGNVAGGNLTTAGVVSAGGNVTGANIFTAGNVSAVGNITGGNLIGNFVISSISVPGNVTGGNINSGGLLSVVGNIIGGNIITVGSTGNITGANYISGNFFVGNGSLLTGIENAYNNANVTALLAAFGSNTISTTGNVTTGNLQASTLSVTGNITNTGGTFLTGNVITGSGSDFLLQGNLRNGSSGLLINSNGATIQGTSITATTGNITATSGNIVAGGRISATGNISTAGFFLGNGSQLTGVVGTYSDPNVATFLASFGSNTISTTGNVTAGNITGANILTSGLISATGNITGNVFTGNGSGLTNISGGNVTGAVAVANTVAFASQPNVTSVGTLVSVSVSGNTQTGNLFTGGEVSATGNITGNYILGNGSQLSGLPATYSNANVTSLLASFGSNSISTTGNVTAGYVIGNGSLLTSITGANVTGTVANATFATSSGTAGSATTAATVTDAAQPNITSVGILTAVNTSGAVSATGNVTGSYIIGNGSLLTSITGANVTGTVANATYATSAGSATTATTAATVTDAAQPNITSVGTLTSITSTGNVTGGNVLTGGIVSATGNITGNYFIGNGSQLTGISGGGYGNANVADFLANGFGSNAITTTGNIQGGNLSSLGVANVGTVSATGNISGSYFLGNGSQLSGIVAASAGGANTYIQFNNAGGFDGVSNMTYDTTTGNVNFNNVIINSGGGTPQTGGGAQLINTANSYAGGSLANVSMGLGQIQIGNGFFGNLRLDNITARPYAKFQVWDSANIVEAASNSVRYQGGYLGTMASIGNIANNSSLIRGAATVLTIGGGPSSNSMTTTNGSKFSVMALNQFLAVGNPNGPTGAGNIGNVTISGAAAAAGQIFVYTGSTVGNLGGLLAQINSQGGTVTNAIGVQSQFTGNTVGTAPTNVIGYYMPGISNQFGETNANIFRQSASYYFLRNDDAVAQNQLGSLRAYHTFQSGGNTTGTWDIDKTNGQVQAISLTGNVTIGTYTNFVTTASNSVSALNQTDTVTLIIEQGATPYTVTMPTGNAAIRYASGNSTVPATANSTTTISIQAYRSAANTAAYITTISPAAT